MAKRSTNPVKPISEARLAANRANAQKSTGPRTPLGKLRSAANACKHGFAGSNFAVVRLELPGEIDQLKADLVATYQPVNPQEMFTLERIALAQQSLLRSYRLESGLFTAAMNHGLDPGTGRFLVTLTPEMVAADHSLDVIAVTRNQNRNFALGAGFHEFIQHTPDSFSLLLRYQAQAERNYRRGVEEFERLRSLRGQLPVHPDLPSQPVDPQPLATAAELSWRFPQPEPKPHPPNEPTSPPQPPQSKPLPRTDPASNKPTPTPPPRAA